MPPVLLRLGTVGTQSQHRSQHEVSAAAATVPAGASGLRIHGGRQGAGGFGALSAAETAERRAWIFQQPSKSFIRLDLSSLKQTCTNSVLSTAEPARRADV